jgi:serine beta-lactamase-like protein LACTB, mitochondrial
LIVAVPSKIRALIACSVALACRAPAQESEPATRSVAGLERAIGTELAEIAKRLNLVGVSAAVVRDGAVAATAHAGFEDRERGVAASDATMYRWASISKPLTAVVAMQLHCEKVLAFDRDVRTLIPEFPEKPWPITVRDLLCHQGGVVHYTNGKVVKTQATYGVEHPFADVVVALDAFKESDLLFEPGTRYSYTTHGYMLLGAACERAAKKPFAELVRERIAATCGMTTLQPDYQWIAIPHRAVGYRKKGDAIERSTDTDVSWKLAGGGFISTVGDLARFGAAMLGTALVDAPSKAAMWTPQKTRSGEDTGYGFGFRIVSKDGRRRVLHSGAQEKTATFLLVLPDEPAGPVAVAMMTNTEGAGLGPAADAIAAICCRR